MKISRKSWHYKIRNLGNTWHAEDDNLCRYFWMVVIKLVVILATTVWAIGMLYLYFTSPFWISTTILILFLIFSIVLPILAIALIRKWLGHPAEFPKETLILEYLKAKKNKVCPLIDFED